MSVYKTVYEAVSGQVLPYIARYPFSNTPVDMEKGYCSFYEVYRKSLTSGRRHQVELEVSKVSSTVEIAMQIDLVRFVNYEDAENNAPAMASRLHTYLKSYDAMRRFDEAGFDMSPVWGQIHTDGFWGEQKKWVQKAHFEIVLFAENSIILEEKPLKYVDVEKVIKV